jgi:hypothetical protein
MVYKLDGYTFDDPLEADCYLTRKHMKMNGRIIDFKIHPQVVLVSPHRKMSILREIVRANRCVHCVVHFHIQFRIHFLVIEKKHWI